LGWLFLGTFVFLFFSCSPTQAAGPLDIFKKAWGFIKDPKGNLFKWVGGDSGLVGAGLTSTNRLFLGDLEKLQKEEGTPRQKEEGVPQHLREGTYTSLPPMAIVIPGTDYYFTGGLTQLPSQGIAMIYASPPASGVYYASTIFQKLRGQPVYAAGEGFGYNQLRGILEIWKAMRNIAYALLTIVFLFVGLAIMFRVKISPQAVLTVENALPKLIGALVLITFSYAIAGFMIDLMYVAIALIYNVLPTPPEGNIGLSDFISQQTTFTFGGHLFKNILLSLVHASPIATRAGALVTAGLGALGGGLIGSVIFGSFSWLPLLGAVFIFALIFFVFVFRFWFNLLKVYLSILISIIFSPLIILAGVLPNSPFGFGKWIKSLIANLAVFPGLFVLFRIAQYIVAQGETTMWKAPIIGSGLGNSAPFLISLALLLILPSLPLAIKAAIEGKEVPTGQLISGTVAPIMGLVAYPVKTSRAIIEDAATKKASQNLKNVSAFRAIIQSFKKEKEGQK